MGVATGVYVGAGMVAGPMHPASMAIRITKERANTKTLRRSIIHLRLLNKRIIVNLTRNVKRSLSSVSTIPPDSWEQAIAHMKARRKAAQTAQSDKRCNAETEPIGIETLITGTSQSTILSQKGL